MALSTAAKTSSDRRPTMRSIDSTLSILSSPSSNALSSVTIDERIKTMADRAKNGTPFTDEEIKDVVNGLKNLAPIVDDKDTNAVKGINFTDLENLLSEVAHLSHKDWAVTSGNSDKLCQSLSIESAEKSSDDYPLASSARQLLERVIKEGNWDGAVDNASRTDRPSDHKSWAVLVTGVNGIRKTTSMYQPWFGDLLSEALVCPPESKSEISTDVLPTGSNSFFRQLDHMICTLCNEEFTRLYAWSTSQLPKGDEDPIPSDTVVDQYSNYKAAIFSRYRTLSELLGALLLKQAQKVNLNCMLETSGRDVAMFHYVDHFFGDNKKYNKLALHFTINDLTCAKKSVDRRMIAEMQRGATALDAGDVFDIVYTNQGGPYGSKVLEGVQKDSDNVWESQVLSGSVGEDWYKATIAIDAHDTEPWTAQAVKSDGSLGTKYTFEPRK
eukprot:CAMPEP_0201211620 /NCGR_PEP_ID=MMETSP0851-20130426/182652_1 /ASSEMBLY_ACC=CAM_ASM_000631 /TAXON_ID=183588 /ORGANISM="Pseudo-nitzschia fraudulenta, Strain WWA7" /LENGTH=440 /DNA_ID=CAMNT_0047500579 /DNA_START=177 /DNA_END=1499 /DNA_ORIENTATION=-